MLLPIRSTSSVQYLRLVGTLCVAMLISQIGFGQDCFFTEEFSGDTAQFTIRPNDCDSNIGDFGYVEGRFTVNDSEGNNCNAFSGNADSELEFSIIGGLQDFRNITLTFDYEIEDRGDGFECASVFGNGDDQIALEFIVDGQSSGRKLVFCEDTAGGVTQRRRAQFAIPDGNNLRVIIYAGTQAPSEFFYFDNLKVCGTPIDAGNPPADPPAPDETTAPFQVATSSIQCASTSSDILPGVSALYPAPHDDGMWFDSDGDPVGAIIPSVLPIGANLYRYILPDGNVSEFTLTVVDDNLGAPILGPFCQEFGTVDLPEILNGFDGSWSGTGTSGMNGLELELDRLNLGSSNEIWFEFNDSGCGVRHLVEIIEPIDDLQFQSCPPGTINLLNSVPALESLVEEIIFFDINLQQIPDPTSVDLSNASGTTSTFIHQMPDVGCNDNDELTIQVNTNCSDALSATISIDPANGNICEGECGEVRVDITGGTPPYEVKFRANLNVRILGIPLPTIPFPSVDVTGDFFIATICSAPDIELDDVLFQNDIIYDATTVTWNIPSFITERGTIGGSIVDATGTEVAFVNTEVEMQAFEKPDFPIDESDIEVCADDIGTYADLPSVDNFAEIIFYDGDPDAGGTEITDFSSIDLLDLFGIWTNPEGCQSDPTQVTYTVLSESACSMACTDPPTPVFIRGEVNQEWCDDGSFPGFEVRNDNFIYQWFDDNNVRILDDNVRFDPGIGVEGDFFVTAVDPNNENCRSAPLNFSFNFSEPDVTVQDCALNQGFAEVTISLKTDEVLIGVTPFLASSGAPNQGYKLFSVQENTDYILTIETANGCQIEYTLLWTELVAECTETCNEAGDDVSETINFNAGESSINIDLVDLLVNNVGVGIFVDEDDNEVSNPYRFTQDVVLYHFVEGVGGCMESRARLDLQEACKEAGENVTEFIKFAEGETSRDIDLTDLLMENTGVGIFLDENRDPIGSSIYTFTDNVVVYHVIEATGGCSRDEAEITINLIAANIDGKICLDNVFCDEIEIVLGTDVGAGAPFSFQFRIFNLAPTNDIVFQPADVREDSILVVNVCVDGNASRWDRSTRTLIVAEGSDEGEIVVQQLRDADGNSLGNVPPVPITFSSLPRVNPINDVVVVCLSEATSFPINDLNDQILTSPDDLLEWWDEQPSLESTTDDALLQGDAAVNPNDEFYALVTNQDGCKVEVKVDFTIENDETVEVIYDPIYCTNDLILPVIVDNGFDISFNVSPLDGVQINKQTGELTEATVDQEYVVSWNTAGVCPDIGEFRVIVHAEGDQRCDCTAIIPEIRDADLPPQPGLGLEGNGIVFCQGDDDPPLVVVNTPFGYEAVWYEDRAFNTELFRGDVFTDTDDEVNYFVRFEDEDGCIGDETATFTIKRQASRPTTRPISLCLDEESSIDLNSFVTNIAGYQLEWIDPNGNVIDNVNSYMGDGLDPNVRYVDFIQNYTDPEGCSDSDPVQFTMTTYRNLVFDDKVCSTEGSFYSLRFEAPETFLISTDVGKLSQTGNEFLIDSVTVGIDINLTISNVFDACPFTTFIESPLCNCDALPSPRTVDQRDTICFEESFLGFDSNGEFTVNWYAEQSGGIALSTGQFYDPPFAGTYYIEIEENATGCVSSREPLVKLPNIDAIDEQFFNSISIITCQELQDSFRVSNTPDDYTVVWLDDITRTIVHTGPSFRPNETDYPPGPDYVFRALYQNEEGCIGALGRTLDYRIYERPRFTPRDTTCSEDLATATFEFVIGNGDIVLAPQGTQRNGNGNFELTDIPLGETVELTIGRARTGVTCMLDRSITFDPADTCPCPDIPDPDPLGPSAETVCSDETDFEFEVRRIRIDDVVAVWYDNADATGDPLLSNSLSFVPPDSGAYFVQLVDTLTECSSAIIQLNLFYDDVPNAGTGDSLIECGVDSVDLAPLLVAPFDEGGWWEDASQNMIDSRIAAADYSFGTELSFYYIVENASSCTDSARVSVTLQAPFNAGTGMDLDPICDQADELIDFEAIIGVHDAGAWLDNDMTGIDLNVDPMLNSSDLAPGEYVYTFVVDADDFCDSETSDVRLIILPLPNVGEDTRDTICGGEEFGYSFAGALQGNPDLSGEWIDNGNVLGQNINDNPGNVDLSMLAPGDYEFSYNLASGSCNASSIVFIHVRENNFAGLDTLVQICNDGSLSLNFERIFPDANGFELSIDGDHNVDFSVPENVDFSSLATGAYRITNVANTLTDCEVDMAVLDLVIEGAKLNPDLQDDYQVCHGDTIVLSSLVAMGGVFEELMNTGVLVGDTLFTERMAIDVPLPLTYSIPPDSVCVPTLEPFTVTAIGAPTAGTDVTVVVCQGDSIDLATLLPADADLGGIFEDIETTGVLIGTVVFTATMDEATYSFAYQVGDDLVCPSDFSLINLDIRATPDLPDMIDFLICEDEVNAYDLTAALGSIDLTGEWININSIPVDLSDPTATDLSQLNPLEEYQLAYALSNDMCADTAMLNFQIDASVFPGQAGVFRGHCEGVMEVINLFDLLDDEDEGTWFDQNGVAIADPTNFDLGALDAASYTFQHKVENTTLGFCEDDSVSIQILVEAAPNAGADEGITLCQNDVFDLRDLIAADIDINGVFEDQDGHGNLVGSIVDLANVAPGDYSYYYVLATNASCPTDVAILTLTVVTDINAGEDSGATVCQGETFDITNLLADGGVGGRFENAASQSPLSDVILNTENLEGIQSIWYIIESSSCASDTAILTLDVLITPDLGSDIDFVLCQSEALSVNFIDQLGPTRDQSGDWLDMNNTGLDFTDPANVDLSDVTPLVPDTVQYTVSNGNCADTIDVIFTLDKSLFLGEAGVTDEHCFGRSRIVNLYDYFTNEDQGEWSVDGNPIADPTMFDLGTLDPGSHTFSHSIVNSVLGVCPPPPIQTVQVVVHPAAFAGGDKLLTLCQGIDYNLLDALDADADTDGVFTLDDGVSVAPPEITTNFPEGDITYFYQVAGNANCDPDTAFITLTIVSEIDAGEQNGADVCQGADFDLGTLVINGDPGGRFEEVSTGRVFADPILSTDALSGDIDIRYIVESPSCDADTAEYVLTVNPVFDILEEINIAEGDSVLVNGVWYNDDQMLVENGLTSANCDSTVTTVITVSDINVVVTNVTCTGEADGIFTIGINAGTPTFEIQINQIEGGNNAVGGSLLRFGELSFDQFSVGDYAVMITDGGGELVFDDTLSIGIDRQIVPTVVSTPSTCFGSDDGSLLITELLIEGEMQSLDAYTYSWSTGDMTISADMLAGGFYQLLVTDTLTMCPYEFEYFVAEPERLRLDTIINDFQCGDGTRGSIQLEILSNIEDLAEFSLDGGPIQGVGLFSDLEPGTYSVTINFGECSETIENLVVEEATDNVIEIEPNDLNLVVGQEEQINVLINFQAIDVVWTSDIGLEGLDTTDQLNPILTGVESNQYIITATDGFGCTISDTLIVDVTEFQDPIPDIYIPNVFNPEDPTFGIFKPFVEENYPGTYSMKIFNRWGNLLHESENVVGSEDEGWDGTSNGRLVEIGVYTYMIDFTFDNGTVIKRTGDITVIY